MSGEYLIVNEREFEGDEFKHNQGIVGELIVGIIDKNFQSRLMELVLKHHIYNKVCWLNSKEMTSHIYDIYLSMILRQKIFYEQRIKKIILISLVNEGFISNGFIKEQYYSKIEYHEEYRVDDYQVENSPFEPIVQTEEEYLTSEELVVRFVECGLIKEVAPNLYKNVYKIKPKDD